MLADALLPRGGAWGSDHTILFVPAAGGVLRISDAGGEITLVTRLEPQQAGHTVPQFLPDGRHFVYYVMGGPEIRGVYVAALDGSNRKRLVPSDRIAVAVLGEYLLFVQDTTLYAQHLDPQRLELDGDLFKVTDDIALEPLPVYQAAALSASAHGEIIYRTGSALQERQFIWFSRNGTELARIGTPDRGVPLSPALSADGRQIAVHRIVDGNTDIYLLDTERGGLTRFTTDPANDIHPLFSPDGSRIVFTSNRTGSYQMYEKSTGRQAEDRLLMPMWGAATDWSPDGKLLLLQHRGEKTKGDLWVRPFGVNEQAYPVLATPFEERDARFSPDGAWIAYASTESNQYEVYVQPLVGNAARIAVSVGGGAQPRWRSDGKELYFVGLDGQLMAVQITLPAAGGSAHASSPVPLFATHIGGPIQAGSRTQYFPSSDGSRFLVNTILERAATSPITVLVNWKPPAQTSRER